MQHQDQDLIRARAHQIWEREGRPEGRHLEHWDLAATELSGEVKAARKPASLAKARARKIAATKGEKAVVAEPRKRTARKGPAAA